MTNILEEIGPLEENFGVSCSRWSVRCLNIRNLAEFVNLDRQKDFLVIISFIASFEPFTIGDSFQLANDKLGN